MTFREDESRVRSRRLADNLSWLRRLALSLLKQHPSKRSIAMMRRVVGWSVDFMMEVLAGLSLRSPWRDGCQVEQSLPGPQQLVAIATARKTVNPTRPGHYFP